MLWLVIKVVARRSLESLTFAFFADIRAVSLELRQTLKVDVNAFLCLRVYAFSIFGQVFTTFYSLRIFRSIPQELNLVKRIFLLVLKNFQAIVAKKFFFVFIFIIFLHIHGYAAFALKLLPLKTPTKYYYIWPYILFSRLVVDVYDRLLNLRKLNFFLLALF